MKKINDTLSVNKQVTKTVWHTFICILKTISGYRFVRTYSILLFRPLSTKTKHQIVNTGIFGGRIELRSEEEERLALFILHIFILGNFFYN